MNRIHLPCIQASLFVHFDYDKYAKNYIEGSDDYSECQGLHSGNGIYIDLEGKHPLMTALHEVSHYIDWLISEQFPQMDMISSTELRARLIEYLYGEVIKLFEKRNKRIIANATKKGK